MRRPLLSLFLATLFTACGGSDNTTATEDDAGSDVSLGEADSGSLSMDSAVSDAPGEDSADLDSRGDASDTTPPSDTPLATDTTMSSDTKPDVITKDAPAPGCVAKGGFCTWAMASRCCSGSCDGDSCNGYPVGHTCSSNAQCQLNNCVGGICACAIGDAPCGPASACVDIENNDAHCGACGKACGPNQRCLSSKCECKDSFTTNCGADCYDTRVEEAHCGGCGKACRGDQVCAFSACTCATGSECKGACLSFATDPANCGACGTVCPADRPRCSGALCVCATGLTQCPAGCKDLKSDRTNCGTCGNLCNGMKSCVAGACM